MSKNRIKYLLKEYITYLDKEYLTLCQTLYLPIYSDVEEGWGWMISECLTSYKSQAIP